MNQDKTPVRIPGEAKDVSKAIQKIFAQQQSQWGEVLQPYEIYARRPTIFSAVVAMWRGLDESGLLPGRSQH